MRAGFTLLEVLLASAISALILTGLYMAIRSQVELAEVGRSAVERAVVARSVLLRLTQDVAPSVGLPDPGRFRSTDTGAASLGGTTPTTGTTTDPASGMGSGMGTGTGMEEVPEGEEMTATIDLVRSFVGDAQTLQVWVSRVPRKSTSAKMDETTVVSDQRLVLYWLAGASSDNSRGLARQEIPVTTASAQDVRPAIGTADEVNYILAKEVTKLEFSYFDGTSWLGSWDGRSLGEDMKTPIGPPMAIQVLMEVTTPGRSGEEPVKRTYRHVIAIPTANGLPLPQPEMPLIQDM